MATYKIVNPGEGWPAVTQTGTYGATIPPPMRFGQRVRAFDNSFGEGEFVFVYGSNVTAGNICQITGINYGVRVAGSATASSGPVGFAPAAMSATNVWGFLQVYGVFDSASHSAAAAAGVAIKMGPVDGQIDSRTASDDVDAIWGAYNAGSNTASNAASVMLHYPIYRAY